MPCGVPSRPPAPPDRHRAGDFPPAHRYGAGLRRADARLTKRSFLFAPTDPDAATTRLIATAASATGFMKGEPGLARPGWYVPGADNRAMLTELRDQLALSYPEAGAPLWAVRLWTNLLWQPAYLAVIAVHLHGAVPDLLGLSQQRRGIYVDGFRLMPQPMRERRAPGCQLGRTTQLPSRR